MQARWLGFWFDAIDARQYAILRIAIGALSALYLFNLLPYASTQFSRDSWLAGVTQPASDNRGAWSLLQFDFGIPARVYTYAVFALGIAAALAMTVGWYTRLATALTWLVMVSLWNSNPLLLDGDDALLKVLQFYLFWAPCGLAWSVDARGVTSPVYVPVWPLRLLQGQMALLYFVSGWVKFHSSAWLQGDVLTYVLVHPQYARFDGSSWLQQPVVLLGLAGLSHLIRWWELLFPLLLCHRRLRLFSLALGVAFHVSLLLFMSLRWFPLLMLSTYPALLPNALFLQLLDCWRRLGRAKHASES